MRNLVDLRFSAAFAVFLSGILAGTIIALVSIFKTVAIVPATVDLQMTYTDFVTILLSCIAIIMTAFGVIVAVLAFWGFNNMAKQARIIAKGTVENSLQQGGALYAVAESSLAEGGALHNLTKKTLLEMTYGQIGITESSGDRDPVEESRSPDE